MTIYWRDSSSTITDSIEEQLEIGFLTQIPTDSQVMQVQLEKLDEFLEEPTITKAYRGLANVFSPSNANSLLQYQDENHTIDIQLSGNLGKHLHSVYSITYLSTNSRRSAS